MARLRRNAMRAVCGANLGAVLVEGNVAEGQAGSGRPVAGTLFIVTTGNYPHLLLEAPPCTGKTTLVRRLVDLLRHQGTPVAGFTTRELREHGQRVGFVVEDMHGGQAIMAHVEMASAVRVGRYGVDLAAFERVALPAMEAVPPSGVVVLDELGRMELASERFVRAVDELLTRPVPMVATVHVFGHPVTDALKARPDVRVIEVTRANRDSLPGELMRLLMPGAP